jgi:Uma2 family endonuclease
MATAEKTLLTAEEFGRRPDDGRPEELVRGRIVMTPPPGSRHGKVCSKADRIIGNFVEEHDLGHVLSNDSGVITERDPDTVRGADVMYYSYDRVPPGPVTEGYLSQTPDLVVEVLSPSDRWAQVVLKVGEYLNAGVRIVLVVDPGSEIVIVYSPEGPPNTLRRDDELTLPDVLPGFCVAVSRLFG